VPDHFCFGDLSRYFLGQDDGPRPGPGPGCLHAAAVRSAAGRWKPASSPAPGRWPGLASRNPPPGAWLTRVSEISYSTARPTNTPLRDGWFVPAV